MHNFYITTPIYYVNANPHLGHAYTTIVADSITRFHKALGEQTLFLTGTDEHGDKIVQAAEKHRLTPRQFVDEISGNFRNLWPALSVRPDKFNRTTDERHTRAVQDFLQRIYDKGDIYFGEFGGHYCFGCERFYTEKELDNGLCPQHLTKPQYISEKNYFFRMSAYLPWLKQYLTEHQDLIRPDRYFKEALAMLEGGVLEDLCISRPKSRLTWGIDLPFDHDYVCYVWFDALLSYIDDLGWPDGEEYKKFWPGEHLIAKDILKPHAIFWPCMLKAADMPIYSHLNVHGYWLVRDTKMSKSLGNVIEPLAASREYGLDAFRYFLLREMHFGSDACYSEEALISRINADLANDLGNLFSRVLSMCGKYFASSTPAGDAYENDDQDVIQLCGDSMKNYIQLFGNMEFAHALEALWQLVRSLNKYVDTQAPWKLAKEKNRTRLCTVMALLLACLRKIAICLWPVMPDASAKMLAQLGEEKESQLAANGMSPVNDITHEASSFALLPTGQMLAPSSNLFPRMEMKQCSETKEKDMPEEESSLPNVDIETFKALDIRAGTILSAEKHPNADRILLINVDFGEKSPRQILSGLAQFYTPAELAGRKVCAILNLKPRKIRGMTSHGMLLTVEDKEKTSLLSCDSEVANGARIA